jgi:hypothetical protein
MGRSVEAETVHQAENLSPAEWTSGLETGEAAVPTPPWRGIADHDTIASPEALDGAAESAITAKTPIWPPGCFGRQVSGPGDGRWQPCLTHYPVAIILPDAKM